MRAFRLSNSSIQTAAVVLLLVTSSLLVSCSALSAATPPTAGPPPTLQPLSVALPAALEPLRNALHLCAIAQPEIALFVDEGPNQQAGAADLVLSWGEPSGEAGYAATLADEEVMVILHPENPARDLGEEEIAGLFSGRISLWSEVGGADLTVQPWTYPPGDKTRQVFDTAILGEKPISPQSILAADPEAMLKGIGADPGAIGYVPRAWLNESVRAQDGEEISAALRQQVLALAKAEPQGAARSFLYCLQSGAGKEAVEEVYSP